MAGGTATAGWRATSARGVPPVRAFATVPAAIVTTTVSGPEADPRSPPPQAAVSTSGAPRRMTIVCS